MGRYFNALGYSPEELEQMHQQAYQAYDNAVSRNTQPNMAPQSHQSSTTVSEIQQRVKDYEQKYNDTNPVWNGIKTMNIKDWKDVAGNSLQGLEHLFDGLSLGAYSYGNQSLGKNYQQRKNAYYKQADQEGLGNIARNIDEFVEWGGSNLGMGKVLSKILPSQNIRPSTKIFMDDVIGSGISNVNQSGSLKDADNKFIEGTMQSPYIRLMKYFFLND